MLRLTDLHTGLLGERCTGAAAIPKATSSNTATSNGSSTLKEQSPSHAEGLPIEVLLQGESRLVVVHESEDAGSLSNRLLGARKKPRAELGSTKAILAYPPPDKPSSQNVSFDMSIAQRPGKTGRSLFQPRIRPPGRSLFDQSQSQSQSQSMVVLPSTEDVGDELLSAPSSQQGLLFVNDLSFAADQPDDEFEVEGRDIEQELMDIMEIDRELEQLEHERERGTKRVFFEEG